MPETTLTRYAIYEMWRRAGLLAHRVYRSAAPIEPELQSLIADLDQVRSFISGPEEDQLHSALQALHRPGGSDDSRALHRVVTALALVLNGGRKYRFDATRTRPRTYRVFLTHAVAADEDVYNGGALHVAAVAHAADLSQPDCRRALMRAISDGYAYGYFELQDVEAERFQLTEKAKTGLLQIGDEMLETTQRVVVNGLLPPEWERIIHGLGVDHGLDVTPDLGGGGTLTLKIQDEAGHTDQSFTESVQRFLSAIPEAMVPRVQPSGASGSVQHNHFHAPASQLQFAPGAHAPVQNNITNITKVDIEHLSQLVATARTAFGEQALEPDVRNEVDGELGTIESQLKKKSPDFGVVKKAATGLLAAAGALSTSSQAFDVAQQVVRWVSTHFG